MTPFSSLPRKDCSVSVNQSHVPTDVHRRVHANLGVAESIARGFTGHDREDLRQLAYLGLVKASRGYDPRRGEHFLAYAVPTVTGEIKRYLRDCGHLVRPPRRLQELRFQILNTREVLEQELRREPTARELAESLGAETREIVAALAISPWPVPLTALPAVPTGQELRDFERFETASVLASALRELRSEERRV